MIPTDTPKWLQAQRNARNWSQAELAARVGVSQATISTWERGKFVPDDVQMERLYAIFGQKQLRSAHGLQTAETVDVPPPLEGEDTVQATEGWGEEYPLDSVMVRSDVRTAGEIVRRISQGRYELNPDFQRAFVWTVEKQSRLIESCTMRIPLPVFYVAENEDGKIIVVDGLQRLTTFDRFLNNQFKLTFPKSEDMPPHRLEGKYFKDLEVKHRERIEDTQLTLYILDSRAPERARLDIFERVNGGEPLTRQQMRNCLYNGPATSFLRDAAATDLFTEATGCSLDRKRMRDREAINRFCAFSILGWQNYNSGDMDGFLGESLKRMSAMAPSDLAALRESFDRAMRINFALFGRHAFRKSLTGSEEADRSILNIALFDVCSVVLGRADERRVEESKQDVRQAIRDLIAKADFNIAITYSTNSRKQVHIRFEDMESATQEVLA
jgi:transcriptional regulator with XRE-family HTH domain